MKEMLTELKFPEIFIKRIMACVTSVTPSINLNGQECGSFEGGRGLREGDPLSPLFFVRAMKYLSRLIGNMSSRPDFCFHPKCKALKITHLMFADDLIIFCKADPKSLQLVFQTLQRFHESAGLKTNLQKSQIVFGGCLQELQRQCLNISGF